MSLRAKAFSMLLLVPFLGQIALAQETPATVVEAYDALADTILAVRAAELNLVRSILDGHRHAAQVLVKQGDWEGAAAQMALFANEGDNAIAGVRKRLLEGGHHFNADGEEQGIFEPGFVVVTRKAKKLILDLSTAIRQEEDNSSREKAFSAFLLAANELLEAP